MAASVDALTRALAPGQRTRRETLRVVLSASSLAALATLPHAEARKRHKKRGDSRCKGRGLAAPNGTCVERDSVAFFTAICSGCQTCLCVIDSKGARRCILSAPPICDTTCRSNDDCEPGTICVDFGPCCSASGITLTCAVPCPPA